MALAIYSNATALNARRTQVQTLSVVAVSMQRLSSGLRINSARDDAAGLAISERMGAQVRGANQAIRNANDAISLFQTVDGFAGQLSDGLQRIRELAVQAANASNSTADRLALDKEVQLSLQEWNRAAAGVAFNGKSLADGSFGTGALQLGANGADTANISLATDLRRAALGALHTVTSTDLRVIGAFTLDGTYTTVALGNMDFSRVASAFVGGSTTTTGSPVVDYSGGQTAVISVDGASITLNANYGSTAGVAGAIQAQLNSSNAGEYVVSTVGANLRITKTYTAATGPISPVTIGAVSGAGAGAFTGGTQTAGVLPTAATRAGFTVDGRAVSLTADHSGNVGGLIADIQLQLDAAPSGVGAYVVGGDASGISISSAAGLVRPAVGGFSGTGATVFAAAPAVTLPLVVGDFSIQVGTSAVKDITGNFANAASLAAAVNAQGLGVFASINTTTGALEITSPQAIVVAGAQAGGGGALSFGSLTSTSSGSLVNAAVTDYRSASTTLQRVDAALQTVNTARANYGAMQNRLESNIRNLRLESENVAAARGRIVDADYAREAATLARSQVLSRAGAAVLAQANLAPRIALLLLR